MGSRLEGLLVVTIVILATIPYFFKEDDSSNMDKVVSSKKSTELTNFTQYDINSTNLNFTLTSIYGEEVAGLWYLTSPYITNSEIKSLVSKRAIVDKDSNMQLIKDVKMVKIDGKKYLSQKAIYNIKNKTIHTPDYFTITKSSDVVKGKHMVYDAKKMVTRAKKVKKKPVMKNSK